MMAPHPIHALGVCPPRHAPRTASLQVPGLSLPKACIFVRINPEATSGFMPTNPKPLSRVNITMNLNPFVIRGLFAAIKTSRFKGFLYKVHCHNGQQTFITLAWIAITR